MPVNSDNPLPARTAAEVRCFLRVACCRTCGGPLEAAADGVGSPRPDETLSVAVRCKRCNASRTLRFIIDPGLDAAGEVINPTDEPSRIIDLSQWLGLYQTFTEAAGAAPDPAEAHRLAERAYRCLAEALKFYGEDDLPPETAFFSEDSAVAFRRNPVTFARQHLRDMQARLPTAHTDAGDAPAAATRRKRGWEFWR
jgi:hypothetical protein